MALPRLRTVLGVTVVASLTFNILYTRRYLSRGRLSMSFTTTTTTTRTMDPLEEELALQLLYHACHRIEDTADCLGRCHWCGAAGGIYDETARGERFPCVPVQNPCHGAAFDDHHQKKVPQQHVIVPAKDFPILNPQDMEALQRLGSGNNNNNQRPPSVEIKTNDLPNLNPQDVESLQHLMDPKAVVRSSHQARVASKTFPEPKLNHKPDTRMTKSIQTTRKVPQQSMRRADQISPRARGLEGQGDAFHHRNKEHHINERRMMPNQAIKIPEINRQEVRARNVARRDARKAEYDAMTAHERAKLLVLPNDGFYRYRYYSPIISETFKLMLVPIPKVACTQWLQLFRRMAGQDNWQERVGGLPYTPDINGLTYLSDYNLTEATNILQSPEWTRFVFVRDPKERFLSAYLDKVVNSQMVVLGSCCRHTRDCVTNETTFREFYELTQTCKNEHWDVQSERLPSRIWNTINFVGHMENLEQDARRLLTQVGVWNEYGSSGWGKDGRQAIFATGESSGSAQIHATRAQERMRHYYTPEIERGIEQRYREDYQNPLFQISRRRLFLEKKKAKRLT